MTAPGVFVPAAGGTTAGRPHYGGHDLFGTRVRPGEEFTHNVYESAYSVIPQTDRHSATDEYQRAPDLAVSAIRGARSPNPGS